jgi:hypothetical protein
MVSGFAENGSLPLDPLDPASGPGYGDEGAYHLTVTVTTPDRDFYAVFLNPGDVLGGSISGGAADVVVRRPDGRVAMGSGQDASALYPARSPLPGGGHAVIGYVAEERGWYAVSTSTGADDYELTLEAYRPGTESAAAGATQTVYLDFDGARLNTNIFGGPGVRTLSPLSAFMSRWGLPAGVEDELVDEVVTTVKENLRRDLRRRGLNPDVAIRVLSSQDSPDPFGAPDVTRVVVGGTINESGLDTIGIAQSIDTGNFGHEESALVLLDLLSSPAGEAGDPSLNTYLRPGSHRLAFVGRALGNVVSHEAGHLAGSWHVDQFDTAANIMDQGGNFPALFGVGPDGVGGTTDDTDVDFGEDDFNPVEGFTGIEDTLNASAWAFRRGLG